jgi:hypothetical protein
MSPKNKIAKFKSKPIQGNAQSLSWRFQAATAQPIPNNGVKGKMYKPKNDKSINDRNEKNTGPRNKPIKGVITDNIPNQGSRFADTLNPVVIRAADAA